MKNSAVISFFILMISVHYGEQKAVADMTNDVELELKENIELPVLKKRATVNSPSSYKMYSSSSNFISVKIKDEALYAHNELRKRHNAPLLTWNKSLKQAAQAHANYMAENNVFEHSATSNGENIGFVSVGAGLGVRCMTPAYTIANWYNEIDAYFGAASGVTGHFTQMVWNGSTKLGCAAATVNDGANDVTYLVCQYSPPGNYKNQYEENVNPPTDGVKLIKHTLEIEKNSGDYDYTANCSIYQTMCPDPVYVFLHKYCYRTCN